MCCECVESCVVCVMFVCVSVWVVSVLCVLSVCAVSVNVFVSLCLFCSLFVF